MFAEEKKTLDKAFKEIFGATPSKAATPEQQAAARDKMLSVRESTNRNLVTILTPQQRTQWDRMIGKPFKLK